MSSLSRRSRKGREREGEGRVGGGKVVGEGKGRRRKAWRVKSLQ